MPKTFAIIANNIYKQSWKKPEHARKHDRNFTNKNDNKHKIPETKLILFKSS